MTNPDGTPVVGPGGGPVYDGGYFSMRGADAMSARQDVSQHLDDIVQENRANLATPEAQHQYDTETRRYRAQWANEMGEHYDQQFQQWAVNTNSNGIAVTQNQIASHIADPNALAQDRETLRKYYVQRDQAQLGKTDPSVTQGAVLKADQDYYLTQIRAAGDNGARAKQALDESGSILASRPDYDGIVRQVNGLVFKQQEAPFIQSAITADIADAQRLVHGAIAPAGTPPNTPSVAPTSDAVSAAIGHQEWRGQGPAPTSINGAVGPSQIKPETAVQYGLDPARLNDPAYATQARDTIVSKISALPNVQGDPARIAVGYFSGSGNIAPLDSPTPYIHDIPDGNGKTTSSYVADVTKRLGAQSTPAYPSTADALNATLTDRVDAFRASAEKQWGAEHPDWVEAATSTYERRLNQTVEQQQRQQQVNAHVVQSAMAGPNPPISEDQLRATNPQVAAAWDELQFTNPYVRQGIENRFNVNAKGKALTYGNNFKDYFDRAMAPTGDANRISDPTQLNNYVGPGEDAPLTNTGSDQLTQLMALRNTPQGEAFAAQARTFVDQMHAELTFSNPAAGQFDPKGEALFSRAMAQVAPRLMSAYQNGTLDKALDPKNSDFIGNIASSMARTPAQIMKDRLYPKDSPASLVLQTGTPAQQGLFLLKEAVGGGRLTAKQAAGIAVEHGFFAKPPGAPAVKPSGLQALPVILQSNAPPAGG